ncbi:hypothetical protein SAMD00019534_110840 [Acytostelium subglobosum LB1]|uniref:hypothetical protein n=1 Tax=Acytostelium subglobosum LB1 TaxID=1410327 RepID=UPI000644D55C|nr:hypothetical protein SAMD00019534_110840 [Acytostelium subglobosum LB1]GAM27908.1 hypothetical protein SAMD00019534_110840 [Acytostelium subglobosum LB1]|eukprot:XP_012749191.1 hypothetical protein SAMD00019534_110840 [Acytostelium subglobosum LB1]
MLPIYVQQRIVQFAYGDQYCSFKWRLALGLVSNHWFNCVARMIERDSDDGDFWFDPTHFKEDATHIINTNNSRCLLSYSMRLTVNVKYQLMDCPIHCPEVLRDLLARGTIKHLHLRMSLNNSLMRWSLDKLIPIINEHITSVSFVNTPSLPAELLGFVTSLTNVDVLALPPLDTVALTHIGEINAMGRCLRSLSVRYAPSIDPLFTSLHLPALTSFTFQCSLFDFPHRDSLVVFLRGCLNLRELVIQDQITCSEMPVLFADNYRSFLEYLIDNQTITSLVMGTPLNEQFVMEHLLTKPALRHLSMGSLYRYNDDQITDAERELWTTPFPSSSSSSSACVPSSSDIPFVNTTLKHLLLNTMYPSSLAHDPTKYCRALVKLHIETETCLDIGQSLDWLANSTTIKEFVLEHCEELNAKCCTKLFGSLSHNQSIERLEINGPTNKRFGSNILSYLETNQSIRVLRISDDILATIVSSSKSTHYQLAIDKQYFYKEYTRVLPS